MNCRSLAPRLSARTGALLLGVLLLGLLPTTSSAAAGSDPDAVVRHAGASRVETAVTASQAGWEHADTAVVATAGAFPDALVGGPLAARLAGPLLLVPAGNLPGTVAAELERLGVTEVVLLGGEGAVGSGVADAIAALPTRPSVRRIAGRDRFATAAAAAGAVADAESGVTVVLAAGGDFPDALAGSSLPRADGARPPVLLTTRDVLPPATAEALGRLAPDRVVAVGGRAAIAPAVLDAAGVAADAPVERLAGSTRFGTSGAVLATALAAVDDTPRPLVVATGGAFPDALAAGALAARLGGLLVVSPRFRLTDDVEALVRGAAGRFDRAIVVGGEAAVDREVLTELEAALTGAPRTRPALAVHGTAAGYRGTARPLPASVRSAMVGVSWHQGCPVGLDDLVLLSLTHRTFSGHRADGELVVARSVAAEVLRAFGAVHDGRFPIARMERVDAYGGDDGASMAANNTSAFNCRRATGGSAWSEHAFGTAIDVNPVQNPYVRGGTVLPDAGRAHLDRRRPQPGMAARPGPLVEAFDAIGWGWGGDWTAGADYQHVSRSGR